MHVCYGRTLSDESYCFIVQRMNFNHEKEVRQEVLRAIHNDAMTDIDRGYLRQQVIQFDLMCFGYTFVGQVTAMLKDQRGWNVSFVELMWYMMNMAYYGRTGQRWCNNIINVCVELENTFGTDVDKYFVHDNVRYPAGNLMSLRHDVLLVIASTDFDAYKRLVEGIITYDARGRLMGRYDE